MEQRVRGEPGVSTVVAALLGCMPGGLTEARTAGWHQAFFELREDYDDRLGALKSLHFAKRPGCTPVSSELEDIMGHLLMWGLVERHGLKLQVNVEGQGKLREMAMEGMQGQVEVVLEAAGVLAGLVEEADLRN